MTYDDDALDRGWRALRATGPEFQGWLSNHGPMVVEALARRGRGEVVEAWVAGYRTRLDEWPAPRELITDTTWQSALGDPRRLGDWQRWFPHELSEHPWQTVLATWWPRLVPGIAAGATHGAIRVGHAVHGLLAVGPNRDRLAELADALGYWAARWQPIPAMAAPSGRSSPSASLARVPRIPDQSGGIRARLKQLDDTPHWRQAQEAASPPADSAGVPAFLREVVTAAVTAYAQYGQASPVMLVHAATAPNAVLRTLPALPEAMWLSSAHAAWSAASAIIAAYAPVSTPDEAESSPGTAAECLDEAVRNGDEHAIKLVDTALDVHQWTRSRSALAAARLACEAIRE